MSIKKYTNFDNINSKIDNEGKFIKQEDLFIITKNEIENTEFGECKYDVMEVSVYDINNNLLPQMSGKNVAYIKTGDIKNYVYNATTKAGNNELAIDVEKLLKDLGFTNGILKVNINFVRNKVGSENELSRVWIQEIAPSRQEVRILPLKTKDNAVTNKNKYDFENLQNLSKDFKYVKKELLDTLSSFENNFLSKIDDYLITKYGNGFFTTLKTDFGLSKFEDFRKKIFEDFKESITYYLTNKNYIITDSNFGTQSNIRFEDCERYNFSNILNDINNILFGCIQYNSYFLKRREINLKTIPSEFQIVELVKQIQNNLESFETYTEVKRNIYNPSKINFAFNDTKTSEPIYKQAQQPTTVVIREDIPPLVIDPIAIEPPPPPIYVTPTPEVILPDPVYTVNPPTPVVPIPPITIDPVSPDPVYPIYVPAPTIEPVLVDPVYTNPPELPVFYTPGGYTSNIPVTTEPYIPITPIGTEPIVITPANPITPILTATPTPEPTLPPVSANTPSVPTTPSFKEYLAPTIDIQYGDPTQTFVNLNEA